MAGDEKGTKSAESVQAAEKLVCTSTQRDPDSCSFKARSIHF